VPAAAAAPVTPHATAPVPPVAPAADAPSGAGGAAAEARRKLAERAGSKPAPTPAPAASQPVAPPAPAEPVPPAPAAAPAAAAGGQIEIVDVARAWERVQPALTGVARPRFAPARLLGVEGNVATFSMPNDIHRQRCDEIRGEVEAALGSALGVAVVIRLVTDEGAGRAPAAAAAAPEAPEEEIDLDSLVDAPAGPVKSAAEIRWWRPSPAPS
jgi:hypothetical protein